MDGQRIDAVSGESLNREIEALLDVAPSPEFLARVRARVADETPHRYWGGWQLGIGVASLALALFVTSAIWPSNDRRTRSGEQAGLAVVERTAPQLRPLESERVTAIVESPRSPITRPAPRTRTTEVVAAEHLVPVVNEQDGKAFDAFLATIRGSGVVLTFNESGEPAVAAASLVIDPIAIDPLPDVLEGGVE